MVSKYNSSKEQQFKMKKVRLDMLLFARKLIETISKAQAFIIAGQVEVDGKPITKPGTLVQPFAKISIKSLNQYVSRGGIKLESALKKLNISVKDLICMDIGASTGGFTDCLLKLGARKVYSIDVGRGQL